MDSLWAASKAGTKSSLFRGFGKREKHHLLSPRLTRRTRWATVNAGGTHGINECTVSPAVPMLNGLPACFALTERRRAPTKFCVARPDWACSHVNGSTLPPNEPKLTECAKQCYPNLATKLFFAEDKRNAFKHKLLRHNCSPATRQGRKKAAP